MRLAELIKFMADPEKETGQSNIRSIEDARARRSGERHEPISEGKVAGYHSNLMEDSTYAKALRWIKSKRGLTEDTLRRRKIGWDPQRNRYTIPVYDEDGNLVNIRRYANEEPKMKNALGHGSPARLYPYDNLRSDVIVVCEGEWDALLGEQIGLPTVTGTHGVSTWLATWAKLFEDKVVYVCFDNDHEGRANAKKVGRALRKHASTVAVVYLPVKEDHADLTDWILQGGTAEDFMHLAQLASEAAEATQIDSEGSEPPLPVPVAVIGSMDATTNYRALQLEVSIMGRKDPTYTIPHKARLECTLDAGPKCKTCPMNLDHEGEVEVVLDRKDVRWVSRFIDAPESRVRDLLRQYIGAPKCSRFYHEEVQNQTVEELFVTTSIDKHSADEQDYTQRRIYNIGAHDTKTNTTATVHGTTIPNPKDSHNEFFSWQLEEAVTSLDNFQMTDEVKERLSVFHPAEGQTPMEKCWEIASDLSSNVTKIIGRERLHIAMDLVWHSILQFPLDGKIISRGWLEFLVVGDTRTGKSETAIRLADHYGLGHVIGCEGATFAGLVGGVKQVGRSWILTWGEITLNDRRLVVLDEVSGLSQDIISQLSDIRSRGMAQLTKIETQQTRARCRMVWVGNPRKDRSTDERPLDGLSMIEGLIGQPEDIARLDFAMSVSMNDVPSALINSSERNYVEHKYKSELCRELVLWAWSRKPDQVLWKPEAMEAVYRAAEWLGKRYVDHPPLVQVTNVREKIARLAVALAARTFSTDDTGECVLVHYSHVKDASTFLDHLYSYDNFGYMRVSKRARRNRQIARANHDRIKKWLKENPRVLEFLLDRRGSFRADDLMEMANMLRDEATMALGELSAAKMISKSKAQIGIEPELNLILKELER